jgi:hypothetical protein
MAGALGSRPTPFIVDLGGGDVAVAEEVLDLHNIHIGVYAFRRSLPRFGNRARFAQTVRFSALAAAF